jgi:hypothetical protein
VGFVADLGVVIGAAVELQEQGRLGSQAQLGVGVDEQDLGR